MQIRRPTSARLFPADDTRTAFATSSYNHSDVNVDCLSITRFIQAQGSSVKSLFSNLFPYNNNFVITSDGYFYHYHNDDNAVQNIPKGSAAKLIVRLNRVNDQIRANPCNMVDSFIEN